MDPAITRFLYDGKRVSGTSTPDDLEMEDNDVIEACVEQLGGTVYGYV